MRGSLSQCNQSNDPQSPKIDSSLHTTMAWAWIIHRLLCSLGLADVVVLVVAQKERERCKTLSKEQTDQESSKRVKRLRWIKKDKEESKRIKRSHDRSGRVTKDRSRTLILLDPSVWKRNKANTKGSKGIRPRHIAFDLLQYVSSFQSF